MSTGPGSGFRSRSTGGAQIEPHRVGGFSGCQQIAPNRVGVFGGVQQTSPYRVGVSGGVPPNDTTPGRVLRPVSYFSKKIGRIIPIFFACFVIEDGREREKDISQPCSVTTEGVLQVETMWSFPPITPTYDQNVQRCVAMLECERFYVLTRSVMKESLETVKCMVLHDKRKKRVLFKIRVDVCRRSNNLPEDRPKRAGLGVSRRDCLDYTVRLCKYTWSHVVTTEHQYHQ